MAKLIGTAGHVDHGKTSLIRALTGIDSDRLPEEKKRGMTIDLGFAFLDLTEVGRVSIVDVPGHEKFLHNMLVGALGMDVAILCVDASEGVRPQTLEHLEILKLLPVDQMVVAITKSDVASPELIPLVIEEVQGLLAETKFKEARFIPVSSVTGEGIDALRDELTRILRLDQPPNEGPWYMPIDRVFAIKGIGTIVTGTLARGTVKAGTTAAINPGGLTHRIRSLHWHDEPQEQAVAGQRTAMNLVGITALDVHRGMVVGEPGAVFETMILDAKVTWIVPPKHGRRVRLSLGAEEIMARVFLSPENPELAQFRTEAPIGCAFAQPLIIRDYSPMTVMGGGRVLVPQAKKRRPSEKATVVDRSLNLEEAILQVIGSRPNGMPTEEVARQLAHSVQALGDVFESISKAGKVRGFAGLWLTAETYESSVAAFMEALEQLHKADPASRMHPREQIIRKAGLKWADKPLDRILTALQQEGQIMVEGSSVRSAGFTVRLSPKQRILLDRTKAVIEAAGLNVPPPKDIAAALAVPPQAVAEILRLGMEVKEIVRLDASIFYTTGQLDKLMRKVERQGGSFTPAEFRDLTESSRRFVIPLLEYFDAIRFTIRQGDRRVLARRKAPSRPNG